MDVLKESVLSENIRYGIETVKEAFKKGDMVWNAKQQTWERPNKQSALRGEIRNCNCGSGHMCNADGYCGY